MLHLLPIRLLIAILLGALGLSVLSALAIQTHDPAAVRNYALVIFRWSSSLSIATMVTVQIAWRWTPLLQSAWFPYLGGKWVGAVQFETGSEEETRSVQLEVRHTLLSLKLLMESEESASRTLAVHAAKDADFERYKLYYIYLNERKEGFQNAGARYMGLAVMRVERDGDLILTGNYFTETHRRGVLHLKRHTPTSWWKLWC